MATAVPSKGRPTPPATTYSLPSYDELARVQIFCALAHHGLPVELSEMILAHARPEGCYARSYVKSLKEPVLVSYRPNLGPFSLVKIRNRGLGVLDIKLRKLVIPPERRISAFAVVLEIEHLHCAGPPRGKLCCGREIEVTLSVSGRAVETRRKWVGEGSKKCVWWLRRDDMKSHEFMDWPTHYLEVELSATATDAVKVKVVQAELGIYTGF